MAGLAVPTIHRNGTARDHLLDALMDANTQLIRAMEAVEDTAPNGRDYYPQGGDAFRVAVQQHTHRMGRLQAVREELVNIADAVADQ